MEQTQRPYEPGDHVVLHNLDQTKRAEVHIDKELRAIPVPPLPAGYKLSRDIETGRLILK